MAEGTLSVIRFWQWVGIHRALAVLLLVGAVAGGVAVAADGPAEPASATRTAADAPLSPADAARADEDRAAAERAARDSAQRKAEEAATAAAEQARKASATPSASKSGKPGVVPPPAPASCGVYTGNRRTGCAMVLAHGWDLQQMACLDKLWTKESGWNERARNKSSGAYGIPQAYPASKLASAGSDWETNAATQIKWGIGYIDGRYDTPCKAWSTSQSTGSY
jgi:hypothetical protein